MAGKNQHVVPHGDKWAVIGVGNGRATSVHDTQKQAIDAARTIAQNQRSEVVTHGKDGRIRDSDSYGNDPMPPRDNKH
jgi:ribosomal protein S5